MRVLYPSRIGIWSVFVEGGKPENPEKTEKNPRSKDENQQQIKLNPDMTRGAGIERGPHW